MGAPIVISILTNHRNAVRGLNETATVAQRVGNGFRRMGPPATAALALITVGAKKAVDAASDVAENVSKAGQVFGDQADDIERFAERAEKALGQSKNAALDAASTFGIIGEKAGLGEKETAAFAKRYTTLASDIASFNNTTPEEAVVAISAAMRGESEPIRRYGVLLDDATLRARALKLGLIDNVKKALTPQQKALAASQEILAQTSKAQGDFARTADGAANKGRILAAQQENNAAKIGQQLLPAYVAFQGRLSTTLDFLNRHQSTVQKVALVVAALAAAVLLVNAAMSVASAVTATYTAVTVVSAAAQRAATAAALGTRLGLAALAVQTVVTSTATKAATAAQWLLNAALLANPIGLVIIALVAIGAAFAIAWAKSETFRKIVTGAWTKVKAAASALASFVAANWRRIGAVILAATGPIGLAVLAIIRNWDKITAGAAALARNVKAKFDTVVAFVKGIPGKISGAFGNARTLLSNVGANIMHGLRDGIEQAGRDAIAKAREIAGSIKSAVTGFFQIKSPSRLMRRIGRFVGQGLEKGLADSTPGILKIVRRQGVDTKKEYARQASDLAKALYSQARSRYNTLRNQQRGYARETANAARTFAALSSYTPGENENITAGGIKQFLTDRLTAIRNFNAKVKRLAKLGLSKDLQKQILGMGVEQGTAYAEALAGQSPKAIKELNRLQAKVDGAAGALGNDAAKRMYGAGVNAARGFLRGMKSLYRSIARSGDDIAKRLVRALKRALGIKSPSRVMRGLGAFAVRGLELGLDARRIERQGARLSSALERGFDRPTLSADAALAGPGGTVINRNNVRIDVRLDSSMSEAEMGRTYKRAIKAAESLGIA